MSASAADAPYAALDPITVLGALQDAGFPCDGRLLQLNSYENRVYQAPLDDGRVVVAKFYRPGRWSDAQIAEEHRFALELAEAEVPVVPPLPLQPGPALEVDAALPTLGHYEVTPGQRFRFAVSERWAGRAPELERPDTLAWIGRLLARLHGVGRRERFAHRRTLDVATFGRQPRQRLIDAGFVDPEIDRGWIAASDAALDEVERAFERHGAPALIRLHGDCHAGNVLWRDEGAGAGPHFVDLDDCCMGPAIQDLWMLLPGERGAVEAALYHLLDGYRDFMDFDDRELLLIEPLRTLRMVHHSAWLAERWRDPAFPIAFPWFSSPSYWSQQTTELREQLERMRDL
ncbi:serine/threonine protein kinase [Ideonella sp.]|uniref:serine/threonine protein kinase n=1 Tax=Ideonella sp. TaxID=1929293 RepID=UPI002B45EA45|nr:serine/threonine protein kinase [Ideonella sp.]HJV67747.1 serine/threonine protein kinase [Ideonella sp.]